MLTEALVHSPLALYFVAIAALLATVLPLRRLSLRSILFLAFALLSLALTWNAMFMYFERSFVEAALRENVRVARYTTTRWLSSTSLFDEAWRRVCSSPERWFLSEQLCLFTVGTMTVLLARESVRHRVKRPWAYMIFGQIVAISVAQSLFFASLSRWSTGQTLPSSPKGRRVLLPSAPVPPRPSTLLIACILVSFVTVAATPTLFPTKWFLPNLLFMHLLLVVPLLPSVPTMGHPMSFGQLYAVIAVLSTLLRIPTYLEVLTFPLTPSTPRELATIIYTTFFDHPAQTSISYDVLCTSVVVCLWTVINEARRKDASLVGWTSVVGVLALTPVLGIGATSAAYLALQEAVVEEPKSKGS